jgi:hypothetical protein
MHMPTHLQVHKYLVLYGLHGEMLDVGVDRLQEVLPHRTICEQRGQPQKGN